MKKSVLFLAMLGLASGVKAQQVGPWTTVNLTNIQVQAPGAIIDQIHTMSANECWAVAEENSTSGQSTLFMHTNNTAGTEFDFGSIGASAGLEAANIVGISSTVAVASMYPSAASAVNGGEIVRTTDGGLSWTKRTTTAQFASSTTSFLDFVHMFDANNGVAVGDPNNNYFEIYTTSNGGVSWTRVPQANIPANTSFEYGLTRSFFALGSTIWFGTASPTATDPTRVYKSTNMGVNWTVSSTNTGILGGTSQIAFKDAMNGIAMGTTVSGTTVTGVTVSRTADGGGTWSVITPNNTNTGSFFRYQIDAANGNYYSAGQRIPSAAGAPDFGSSFSTDGINWTNMNNSQGFFAMDVIPAPGSTTNANGYVGSLTSATGSGGIFKNSLTLPYTLPTATRDAALQNALNVYPNPSNSGVFKVDMGSALTGSAQLTVFDALGRRVETRELNASSVASRNLSLDLSKEKTGVYTLQIRTAAGIATQKLVIE